MRAAGCEAWHSADELAVMGLAEVLRHLPRLLRLRRDLARGWLPRAPTCSSASTRRSSISASRRG
jgi:lipid-A-disaccharide synthase